MTQPGQLLLLYHLEEVGRGTEMFSWEAIKGLL